MRTKSRACKKRETVDTLPVTPFATEVVHNPHEVVVGNLLDGLSGTNVNEAPTAAPAEVVDNLQEVHVCSSLDGLSGDIVNEGVNGLGKQSASRVLKRRRSPDENVAFGMLGDSSGICKQVGHSMSTSSEDVADVGPQRKRGKGPVSVSVCPVSGGLDQRLGAIQAVGCTLNPLKRKLECSDGQVLEKINIQRRRCLDSHVLDGGLGLECGDHSSGVRSTDASVATDANAASDHVQTRDTPDEDANLDSHPTMSMHSSFESVVHDATVAGTSRHPVVLDFESGMVYPLSTFYGRGELPAAHVHVHDSHLLGARDTQVSEDAGVGGRSLRGSRCVRCLLFLDVSNMAIVTRLIDVTEDVLGTLRGPVVLDFQSHTVTQAFEDRYFSSQGPHLPDGFGTTYRTGNTSYVSASHAPSSSENVFAEPRSSATRRGPPNEYRRFGHCDQVCRKCRAVFWEEEKLACSTATSGSLYHRCCLQGRVRLFVPWEYPPIISQLFANSHFLENIRAYNQMFAMTSLGANIDDSVNVGRGPYVFKVSGQIYHRIGRFCPDVNQSPRFLQLYIYDTVNEVKNRLSHFTDNAETVLRPDVVEALIKFLDSNNALVQLFRTAKDKLQENDVPDFKIRLFNKGKASQYEMPTSADIGAIVFDDTEEMHADFDVVLEAHSGDPQRINKLHAVYMSAQFPLLFVYGEHGFHLGLHYVNVDNVSTRRGKRMSMKSFYAYQLHDRLGYFNLISRGGRLFQQYVVTAYCSIEQNRMDFIRANQSDIRCDHLAGLYDAISRGDSDGSDAGSRVILPASFLGGPRYMYSHYLDALAICRVHGNPSFFVTFTCNTNWPEIQEYMDAYPYLSAADRPDVVDRIFERKIHALIKYVRERRPFGFLNAVLYTVEFQKRGLPHCHMLLWVNQGSQGARGMDVDKYISAELPDPLEDPEGFRVVSEFMVHGPCGNAFPNAPCMQNRTSCKKYFPKPYCSSTFTDTSGYVHYQRRDIQIHAVRRGVRLDNAYVVPYSRALCMLFYAHINVEFCGNSMLIKYLFKYISKGTDRIIAHVTREIGQRQTGSSVASTSSNPPAVQVDEIKNFVDARFIGPHEACWRIFGFDIHSREPAVQILAVHLQNMQSVTFRSSQTLQSVVDNPGSKRTTLTQWLAFNERYTLGHHLTYLQFPSEFVWSKTDKDWSPRRYLNKPAIGRLAYVHPSAGDLFYERMLLSHQKGCASFEAIRTVNSVTFATNRAACEAMGLLKDDQEWITAMQEASATATASELRALFSEILVFTDVTSPVTLWSIFWRQMSDDVPLLLSRLLSMQFLFVNDRELKGGVLYELQSLLAVHGKSLQDFGLPTPPEGLLNLFRNRAFMEEMSYDRAEMAADSRKLIPLLNDQQRRIFDIIMRAVTYQEQELIFVYGHGGTGKTFLWKTVISTVRAEGKIVLAVASSGIASLLLPSGRTAHSRFKIPLNLTDESACHIKKNTQLAELLKQTEIVIWDEAPMNEKRCFEALDKTLKDILGNSEKLFGGRSVILGGDFRQTLPVKKSTPKDVVIASSIAESRLWPHFKVFFLLQNMRLNRPSMTEVERQETEIFSEWLINIGNGNAGLEDEDDPRNVSWIRVPDKYCLPPSEEGLLELISLYMICLSQECPLQTTSKKRP